MKIRVGDTVKVISGSRKYKGNEGKVLKVFKSENRVLVEGINIVTRHRKPLAGNPGGIDKFEAPIDASNVMLVCPITGDITRVGFVIILEGGKEKKFRFSKAAVKKNGKSPSENIIK